MTGKLRNLLILTTFVFVLGISAEAQKAPAKPAAAAKDNPKITSMLKRSGYGHTIYGKNVWTVESGEAAPVVVTYIPEGSLLLLFMTVAENGKYNLTAESAVDLLKVAGDIAYGKVAIAEDGDLIIRAEWKLNQLDQKTFEELLVSLVEGFQLATKKLAPPVK